MSITIPTLQIRKLRHSAETHHRPCSLEADLRTGTWYRTSWVLYCSATPPPIITLIICSLLPHYCSSSFFYSSDHMLLLLLPLPLPFPLVPLHCKVTHLRPSLLLLLLYYSSQLLLFCLHTFSFYSPYHLTASPILSLLFLLHFFLFGMV